MDALPSQPRPFGEPGAAPSVRAPMAWAAYGVILALALGAVCTLAKPRADTAVAETPLPPPAVLPSPRRAEIGPLPRHLSATGLYRAGSTTEVAPGNLFYVPQYPLWSDGATKRRWVSLPDGSHIDATRPDAWEFPVGTRFWKEFTFGERVETRYIERLPDGTYRYATYVWDSALGDAVLAPEAGVRQAREIRAGVWHDVPSVGDCHACHEGRRSPVLGFGALQLSPDRDPLAPHAEPVPPGSVDLAELVRRRLVTGLPGSLVARPPRIQAESATSRAAAGYLFGNCAGCHNAEGPLSTLGLDFDQSVAESDGTARIRESASRRPSRFRITGEDASLRIVPGRPEQSAVWFRMSSRLAAAQMPPLGTKLVDAEALELVERFISTDTSLQQLEKEHQP